MRRRCCAACGTTVSRAKRNRVCQDGVTQILCAACRYHLPEARRRLEQGEPPGSVAHTLGIPVRAFSHLFWPSRTRICQGPCRRAIPVTAHRRHHPLSGAILCDACYRKARLPCSACGHATQLPRGVADWRAGGQLVFTCRRCRSRTATDAPERCAEPGCGRPIGRGFELACRDPGQPDRRLCRSCYHRAWARVKGPVPCGACGKTILPPDTPSPDPRDRSRPVCKHCYKMRSGYFEKRTDACALCARRRPLVNRHPDHPELRVCGRCFLTLSAPRKIVRLSQVTRVWPRAHQRLFDAALQRGAEVYSDLQTLRGLVAYQPLFPAHLSLSPQELEGLHRWILDTASVPVPPAHRPFAAAALYRAKLELYGPAAGHPRYRLLLNRRPLRQPVSAAELLLDFAEQELPALHYAAATIAELFYTLRRFFQWLSEQVPDVYFLRQIQPRHFLGYQLEQGLPLSAMRMLTLAWRAFAPFATARGHPVTLGAIPWGEFRVKPRVAPVYADPLRIFQALDGLARDERQPPLDRMLAHLLTLAAPAYQEIRGAVIPLDTADGIPSLRRSLLASRRVRFPVTGGSRRHQECYRQLASATPFVPLRSEPADLALYAAVDAYRQATLRRTDCPLLFVTRHQRICPERPLGHWTIAKMLGRVFSQIGLPDLQLTILRNSHALVVAREVSVRPAVIAAATGRSFDFATDLLRSLDLDPRAGLMPLPKIPLGRDYGQPRS